MDTTKTTTHIGLCAGYGGIELGLKRVIPNLRSVALCEIEAFACANLVAKMEAGLMEPAPIWTDLKSFPWESFRDRVDILTGGYPCQPFSAAGKRLGTEDPRHLWPYIASGIRILRPKLCFFENVEGHISLGLREVIGELESMGYKVSCGIFSAREVGAPHQRKRVFILAYDKSLGIQGCGAGWLQDPRPHAGQGLSVCGGNAGCGELANAGRLKPQGWCGAADGQQSGAGRIPRGEPAPRHDQVWPSRPGEPQHAWEPPRVVANNHRPHAGHGEQRPERAHRDLSGGFGEAMGNALMHGHASGEITGGTGAGETEGRLQEFAGGSGNLADTERELRPRRPERTSWWIGQQSEAKCDVAGSGSEGNGMRQTQPSLGRDSDGPADRLDYAELYTSCDNRTDELRLLGNGVVPATAERAFRTLLNELNT